MEHGISDMFSEKTTEEDPELQSFLHSHEESQIITGGNSWLWKLTTVIFFLSTLVLLLKMASSRCVSPDEVQSCKVVGWKTDFREWSSLPFCSETSHLHQIKSGGKDCNPT